MLKNHWAFLAVISGVLVVAVSGLPVVRLVRRPTYEEPRHRRERRADALRSSAAPAARCCGSSCDSADEFRQRIMLVLAIVTTTSAVIQIILALV